MAPETSTLKVALQKVVMDSPTSPVFSVMERVTDVIVSLGTKKNGNCNIQFEIIREQLFTDTNKLNVHPSSYSYYTLDVTVIYSYCTVSITSITSAIIALSNANYG